MLPILTLLLEVVSTTGQLLPLLVLLVEEDCQLVPEELGVVGAGGSGTGIVGDHGQLIHCHEVDLNLHGGVS